MGYTEYGDWNWDLFNLSPYVALPPDICPTLPSQRRRIAVRRQDYSFHSVWCIATTEWQAMRWSPERSHAEIDTMESWDILNLLSTDCVPEWAKTLCRLLHVLPAHPALAKFLYPSASTSLLNS